MKLDHQLSVYRRLYDLLLRLYPTLFYDRFAQELSQIFLDLLKERFREEHRLGFYPVSLMADTLLGIINEQRRKATMSRKLITRSLLITGTLLMIPLVAMFFTKEVNWTHKDFLVAGALILGASLTISFMVAKTASRKQRIAVSLSVLTALTLIWATLAVGILGNENNPVNIIFLGVVGFGILGVILVRFQPAGMAKVLFSIGTLQILAPLMVWIFFPEVIGREQNIRLVLVYNTIFALLFALSGLLFRQSAEEKSPPVTRAN